MRKISLSLILISLIGLSCTKDFSSINTNKLGFKFEGSSSAVPDASGFLPPIMAYIYPSNGASGVASWVYQIQQNFNSDIYSGYWMMAGGFGQGSHVESNYYYYDGWDSYLYLSWSNIVNPFLSIQASAWAYPNAVNQTALGMAFTSKVMVSVRVADALGTLPYSGGGTYDSLGKIYNTFFSELDSAIFYLSKNASSPITTSDYFYGGDIAKWITLTNSLRLELAMRIVKANPTLAQAQAEKAMATGNLITDNSQNAAFVPTGGVEGALTTLYYTWGIGNTTPGADVASYLVGYNDPRLPVFLAPTSTAEGNTASRVPLGGYCTQRLGSVQVPGDVTLTATMFSMPGTGILQSGTDITAHPESSTFFNAAETNFLLSEATLRGWNMGSYTSGAQAYYTAGVTASMNQWKVSIGNYLSTSATPSDFVDPTLPDRDIKAVSTCSPKWDDATSNEGHLEQIITQKWISLWPVNSPVAWAEYRRTGYPKLFPGYLTAVAPTVSWGGQTVDNARKLRLPNSEYSNNTSNVLNAVNNYLGGTDDITTHVWWDVNAPNF
ncbi:MAG TPA: SusD/RagB family nutrient-binding outer membrane lipoprotein [Puia sp.]|nr:SusD/RagB family nutrient-binding outer membrane lipoprotein [Puia sp.]